jgi:hypothetical protein
MTDRIVQSFDSGQAFRIEKRRVYDVVDFMSYNVAICTPPIFA